MEGALPAGEWGDFTMFGMIFKNSNPLFLKGFLWGDLGRKLFAPNDFYLFPSVRYGLLNNLLGFSGPSIFL